MNTNNGGIGSRIVNNKPASSSNKNVNQQQQQPYKPKPIIESYQTATRHVDAIPRIYGTDYSTLPTLDPHLIPPKNSVTIDVETVNTSSIVTTQIDDDDGKKYHKVLENLKPTIIKENAKLSTIQSEYEDIDKAQQEEILVRNKMTMPYQIPPTDTKRVYTTMELSQTLIPSVCEECFARINRCVCRRGEEFVRKYL